MTVLSKIRNRAGLLVAVIGIALLSFVLADAYKSGSSLFGNSKRYVGEIAGTKISNNEFEAQVNSELENIKKRNPQATIDDKTTESVQTQVWEKMVNSTVMGRQYKALGITVSEDELADAMLSDDPHPAMTQVFGGQQGQISPEFADPRTGKLDMAKVRKFVQGMTPEQEENWVQIEEYMRNMLEMEKYNNLIKKGLYTTTAEAKRQFSEENTKMDMRYVVKRYATIPDSTIQVTDADIQKYYNEHQNEFKVAETTRKIEYVTFDVVPSDKDIADIRTDLEKLKTEFAATKEDSSFTARESDTRMFDNTYYDKKSLSPVVDTLFNSNVGTVIGPYQENNAMKISKLVNTKMTADSAHIRHILIGVAGAPQMTTKRTDAQSKALADSLQKVLKAGKAKFEDLVDKYSDDAGKNGPEVGKGKGGDYGWLNAQSGFVQSFKDAGLDNKKGDIVVVRSEYGYHIIEVLDQKGQSKKAQIATIERVIQPSSTTLQSYYQKASAFASKYNTNETFDKGVEAEGLTKRVADNVKEGDKMIPGLESPKTLVRWMYENETGKVSDPFEFGNKFVVAHLVGVKEKGIAPLDQVKDVAKEGAIRDKKAEKFIADLTAAKSGVSSIDDLAKKVNETAVDAKDVTFAMYAIPGAGSEGSLLGTAVSIKQNTLSAPIKGKSGVFVIVVNNVKQVPAPKDYNDQKKRASGNTAMRVDYEVFDALKEEANIVDNRGKFY